MLFKGIVSLLAIVGIAFLLMVVAAQASETVVRPRINMKEPFTDASGAPVTGMVEMDAISGSPADIQDQRRPYHLLRGVLPDAEKDTVSTLGAQGCYETDFQTRFQPVHNYLQRTNNYKRAAPDSCSSPMTQFVTSFYKLEPVN